MAFNYRASITVDHTKVPTSNQSDFPMLVSGTYAGTAGIPDLRSIGNGGKVQNSNGYDIYFYADSALTTRLAAERESYNSVTGAIIYWIKIPLLTTATDTIIYIAYGDSGISTDPNSDATYGKTSTWNSNFKGVYHLPDGTTLSALDSTSNTYSGTITGVSATTGIIDGGANYTGGGASTDKIKITSAAVNLNVGTVSIWAKPDFASSFPGNPFFFDTDTARHAFFVNNTVSVIQMYNDGRSTNFNPSWSANTWHLFTFVYNKTGNVQTFYFDGVSQTGSGAAGTWGNSSLGTSAYIGSRISNLGSNTFHGIMDEVRILNIANSASWIATEYNNQSSPSTFYTLGAETSNIFSLQPQVPNGSFFQMWGY